MNRLLPPLFFLIVLSASGQVKTTQSILSKDWKSKMPSGDTIMLQQGGYTQEEMRYNLTRPCGYEETTLYWYFKEQDTLFIDVTIRACIDYEKLNILKDSVQQDEKSGLTKYETLDVNPKMMRSVTGHRERGVWTFRKGIIEIRGTDSFNGIFKIVQRGTHETLLIRKSK